MKKIYIEPKNRVIEVEPAPLLADSTIDFGTGGGPGTSTAKESSWGWGWDEEF